MNEPKKPRKTPAKPRKPAPPLPPNAPAAQDSTDSEQATSSNEDGSTSQATIAAEGRSTTQADTEESEARSSPLTVAEAQSQHEGENRAAASVLDGGVAVEVALPLTRERLPGEGRAAYWERIRKAARAEGMPRGQGPGTAYEWATRETERLYPPPAIEIVEELPEAEPVAVEPPSVESSVAPIADPGVSGLGEIPPGWPELPANAQLQAEISWVSANRLRVRSGSGVDLSRALSPAPSYSALSWLETSILFPAKFADISVKATAQQDDEREGIRREKLAIEEIRSILKDMLEG